MHTRLSTRFTYPVLFKWINQSICIVLLTSTVHCGVKTITYTLFGIRASQVGPTVYQSSKPLSKCELMTFGLFVLSLDPKRCSLWVMSLTDRGGWEDAGELGFCLSQGGVRDSYDLLTCRDRNCCSQAWDCSMGTCCPLDWRVQPPFITFTSQN